jgi:hypothetical protein
MDTTDLDCFGLPFKLIAFMEAHSRSIFAHQLLPSERAAEVAKVLQSGHDQAGGVLGLRIDRGTPYLAELTRAAAHENGIDMRVARAYQATDKAILERFFRTLKEAMEKLFSCIDLTTGPGDQSYRQKLAHAIGSAVVSAFLRWGYPYTPQPYIDGLSPHERVVKAQANVASPSPDTIQRILEERVRHNEHAQTLAARLHEAYGFYWPMTRWLKAVRGYGAEDLLEASRRFDQILLRGCFNCNPKRNPRYLLAIIRTVAEERRGASRRQLRQKQYFEKLKTHAAACRDEETEREQNPERGLEQAVDLAHTALKNGGLGLPVAQRWLEQALKSLALKGAQAYRLITDRFLAMAEEGPTRTWLKGLLEAYRPSEVGACRELWN